MRDGDIPDWPALQRRLAGGQGAVEAKGRRAHVIDLGQGRAVVALHGLGSLADEILAPLLKLSRRYRLLAPDRAGYGDSEALPGKKLSPAIEARWLGGVLDRARVHRPILVAHSIAAATALHYAMRRPREVAGLVLVAPFCRPTREAFMPALRLAVLPGLGRLVRWLYPVFAWLAGSRRLAAAFAPNPVPGYLKSAPLAQFVRPAALRTMAAELLGFNAAMRMAGRRLRQLAVPTVVIAGEADTVAAADRHAAWLAELLPNAELVRIPGAGHMVQHVAPEAVVAAVDKLAGGATRPS